MTFDPPPSVHALRHEMRATLARTARAIEESRRTLKYCDEVLHAIAHTPTHRGQDR